MKKTLKTFVAILAVALLNIIGLTSCDHILDRHGKLSSADSLKIAQIAKETVNPTFDTPVLAQSYQMDLLDKYKLDSTFRYMTQKQIFDVVTVLIQKGTRPTVESIVDEFSKNKDVYSNLPESPQNPEEIPKAKIIPHHESRDTVIDTVINGKKVYLIKNKENKQ